MGWTSAAEHPDDEVAALRALPLSEYRPRPQLRLPEHRVERAAVRAIDAHNHLGRWLAPEGDWVAHDLEGRPPLKAWTVPDVDELLELLDACNVEAVVNLDGRWDDELEANLERYDRAHPGRFFTFCQLDWREARRDDRFGERLVASLHRSADAGARGLKVWKTLGLGFEDVQGRLLLPGDERIAPVWDAAGELGLPVLIHTADPMTFFEPLDPSNEQLELLLAFPDWSFARPGMPSFDELIGSLEAAIERHPGTTFIVPHAGCVAEDLGRLGRMLVTYPNLSIDLSARMAELGRQPRATAALIRRFPDRVLFGTDKFPPQAASYHRWFRFLETEDEHFAYSDEDPPRTGRWRISALGLEPELLPVIYRDNALRMLGEARSASPTP